jgi:hypothetical protein
VRSLSNVTAMTLHLKSGGMYFRLQANKVTGDDMLIVKKRT